MKPSLLCITLLLNISLLAQTRIEQYSDTLVVYNPDTDESLWSVEHGCTFYDGDSVVDRIAYIAYYYDFPFSPHSQYSIDKDGRKHGAYISYYLNGKLKERSTYFHGLYTGLYVAFHTNGQPKVVGRYVEITCVDELADYEYPGLKVGEWLYFDENGRIARRENYKKE